MDKAMKLMFELLRWFLIDARNKDQKELVISILEGVLFYMWEDEDTERAVQEWTAEILFELKMEGDLDEDDMDDEDLKYFLARLMELQNAVERTCECGRELDDEGLCQHCIEAAEAATSGVPDGTDDAQAADADDGTSGDGLPDPAAGTKTAPAAEAPATEPEAVPETVAAPAAAEGDGVARTETVDEPIVVTAPTPEPEATPAEAPAAPKTEEPQEPEKDVPDPD